jgi:large subunit ribosomal protein L10
MATDQATEVVASRASPRKRDLVASLADMLSRATSTVFTDYRGLKNKELEDLRGSLRSAGVDYLVIKNTLARRAAAEAGRDELAAVFTGPLGLAVGYDDLSAPARLVNAYFKANAKLPITGGWAEGQVLDTAGVKMLADLPSREALLAQLAGTLQSPATRLAGSLESILSNFAATLDAYRASLEAAA